MFGFGVLNKATPGKVKNAASLDNIQNTAAGQNQFLQTALGDIMRMSPFGKMPGSGQAPAGTQSPSTPTNPSPNGPPQTPLPGANGYTPTTAPYGMDQSGPGDKEQFWGQNQQLWFNNPGQNKFGGEGSGQQFWNQVQGQFNNASLQPKFDQYYAQAGKQLAGQMNAQAAGRGAYGSSQALNGVGGALANLAGQQARDYSNFALQDQANQRANLGAYGSLAFQAENQARQDSSDYLDRLNSAFAASSASQDARDTRVQRAFNNQSDYLKTVLGFAQGQYNNIFQTDQGLLGAAQDARLGKAANNVSNQQNNANQVSQGISDAVGLVGGYAQAKNAGLFGGGGSAPAPSGPSYPYAGGPYNY